MLKKWPLSDRCSLERKNFTSSYPWAILTECYFQTMFTGYIKLRISSPFPRPRFSNKLTFQHSLDGHRLFCNFNINFEYLSIRTLQLNWRHLKKGIILNLKFNGEGNGNPLQYSCLENLMDRWAWRTSVWHRRVVHNLATEQQHTIRQMVIWVNSSWWNVT